MTMEPCPHTWAAEPGQHDDGLHRCGFPRRNPAPIPPGVTLWHWCECGAVITKPQTGAARVPAGMQADTRTWTAQSNPDPMIDLFATAIVRVIDGLREDLRMRRLANAVREAGR